MRALGDQIVNQRADVGLGARENDGILSFCTARSVDARHKPLRGCFLVAGGAVELTRTVKSANRLEFQRGEHLQRISAVVFNGVGVPHDLSVFKAVKRAQHLVLHVGRQRGGKALNVHFLVVLAHGLYKELVARFVGKTNEFVLNRGAITGPCAVNLTGIQRRSLDVGENDLVRFVVCIDDMTRYLLLIIEHMFHIVAAVGQRILFAGLDFEHGKIDGGTLDARGCAGLETHHFDAKREQRIGQRVCRQHAVRACRIVDVTYENSAAQVRAGGNNDRGTFPKLAKMRAHTRDLGVSGVVIGQNFHNFSLNEAQSRRQLNGVLHDILIFAAIGLNALGVHGCTLAEIERAGLQRYLVGSAPHFAAQGVNFVDQMPLGSTADRGVAGHIGNGIEREGKEDGVHTHARRGKGGFHTGMSRTDDNGLRRKLHKNLSFSKVCIIFHDNYNRKNANSQGASVTIRTPTHEKF